jgi:Arc/MetJ-type ribon-helix-helix transcriptional regulator
MTKRDTVSITIRLPKDLIIWIDSKVDSVDFRNRTHVIEKALYEYKKKK